MGVRDADLLHNGKSPTTAVNPLQGGLPAAALTLNNTGWNFAGLLKTPCTLNHVVHGQWLGVCSELGAHGAPGTWALGWLMTRLTPDEADHLWVTKL